MIPSDTTEADRLKREIRWCREALAIADNYDTPAVEAYKQQIPLEFRHLCELFGPEQEDELKNHLDRLQTDLENLREGEWQ